MIKKVAILANGGDVSGFNAVIRAIIKTAENPNNKLRIAFLGFFINNTVAEPKAVRDQVPNVAKNAQNTTLLIIHLPYHYIFR